MLVLSRLQYCWILLCHLQFGLKISCASQLVAAAADMFISGCPYACSSYSVWGHQSPYKLSLVVAALPQGSAKNCELLSPIDLRRWIILFTAQSMLPILQLLYIGSPFGLDDLLCETRHNPFESLVLGSQVQHVLLEVACSLAQSRRMAAARLGTGLTIWVESDTSVNEVLMVPQPPP